MRFAILVLFAASLAAADNISEDLTQQFFRPANYSDAKNDVEKEFECIRGRVDDPNAMIKTENAKEILKKLSQPLQDGFEKFKFGGLEKALFYSQVIVESGAFTQLTETKSYAKLGADATGHLIHQFESDKDFKAKAGATKSVNFGPFRGRGLLQISRCDNYFSIMHYLNLMNAGKPPVWKAYWEYGPKEARTQIAEVCSKRDLYEMKKEYTARQGMNSNLYGMIDEPYHIAMLGGNFQDPVTKKSIDSEPLMVQATMAYWRGRCGDTVTAARDLKSLESFEGCKQFKSDSYPDWAAKCVTQCIKGSTEKWQERSQWFQHAMLCQR